MNFTDMMYEAKNAAAGKANATITSNVNGHMVEAYAHQTADGARNGTYRVSWLVDGKRCKFSDLPAEGQMTLCPCGYSFDADTLGIYGCPNCGGDAMSNQVERDKTAERQARSREARAQSGGKQIAVMLAPAAAAKLAAWVARGETIAGIVNRLLTRSKP